MLDVTTDSQSVCKRLRKQSLCGTSMDLFERFEETQRFIDPFWVNSHMAEQEFKTKFGEQNHWRRILNALVDEEVGKRANQERNLPLEVGIKAKDAVARQINKLLAERVQALLSYDKDQGPENLNPSNDRWLTSKAASQSRRENHGKKWWRGPNSRRSQIKQKAETGRSPERGPGSKNHECKSVTGQETT